MGIPIKAHLIRTDITGHIPIMDMSDRHSIGPTDTASTTGITGITVTGINQGKRNFETGEWKRSPVLFFW